ncbi:hypothetical protein B0J11DRAFT_501134 [Dendryphion nanum]|uniref:Uncharacterized protein n=1 Tax=Dendryphion nanum TaxID=256645 RepID=A0A9P9IYX0_9PLEO|nr:hypothetical protein B0J11DRAFT_501134 [Dendryphion nanum]
MAGPDSQREAGGRRWKENEESMNLFFSNGFDLLRASEIVGLAYYGTGGLGYAFITWPKDMQVGRVERVGKKRILGRAESESRSGGRRCVAVRWGAVDGRAAGIPGSDGLGFDLTD